MEDSPDVKPAARFASAIAKTPLSVMRISKDCLLRMMQDNAQFSMAIAKELAQRIFRLTQKIEPSTAH